MHASTHSRGGAGLVQGRSVNILHIFHICRRIGPPIATPFLHYLRLCRRMDPGHAASAPRCCCRGAGLARAAAVPAPAPRPGHGRVHSVLLQALRPRVAPLGARAPVQPRGHGYHARGGVRKCAVLVCTCLGTSACRVNHMFMIHDVLLLRDAVRRMPRKACVQASAQVIYVRAHIAHA